MHDLYEPLLTKSDVPLYAQIQSRLRDAVQAGELKAWDILPTERKVAERLDISRVTVRKAYDGLVNEGLLFRKQGSGTFVSERIEKTFTTITSFSEDVRARGQTPTNRWISQIRDSASAEELMSFGLRPGDKVFRLKRVRFADEQPLAVEISIVPETALPSMEMIDGSLYDAMSKMGARPVRALQRLRAIKFNAEVAADLLIEEGAAGLYIERKGYSQTGEVCEFTQSYYRGDSYDFVAELHVSSEIGDRGR
jgi:GntR family transcriptional regulator